MTGAALGGVIGRRPLVTRRAAARPRGTLGGREEAVEGFVERRRRWEGLRVMKIADSSPSSLSEEESDADSTLSSSSLEASDTDSRSLSSEKTLFSSSTVYEYVDGLGAGDTSACAVTHRRVRASETGRRAGALGLDNGREGRDGEDERAGAASYRTRKVGVWVCWRWAGMRMRKGEAGCEGGD